MSYRWKLGEFWKIQPARGQWSSTIRFVPVPTSPLAVQGSLRTVLQQPGSPDDFSVNNKDRARAQYKWNWIYWINLTQKSSPADNCWALIRLLYNGTLCRQMQRVVCINGRRNLKSIICQNYLSYSWVNILVGTFIETVVCSAGWLLDDFRMSIIRECSEHSKNMIKEKESYQTSFTLAEPKILCLVRYGAVLISNPIFSAPHGQKWISADQKKDDLRILKITLLLFL